MLPRYLRFSVVLLALWFILSPFVVKDVSADVETIDLLMNDMWNYYKTFPQLGASQEKKDLVKQMEFTADKIWEYYKNHDNPDDSESRLVAQAFLLLAMVEYEMQNPTLTYHALQKVNRTNAGVVEDTDPNTNAPFKDKVEGIDSLWLPKFKKCEARVYGFSERNIIWDTLNVEIGITYLERYLREDKIFQAIKGAEDYLNSELRNGKKEITLLLPPGMYRLKTDNLDIYPAHFEVEENSPPTIFDVTPDRYFHLRVFYCRDTITTRIDTIFNEAKIDTAFLEDTSRVYQERPKRYRNYLFAEVDTTFSVVKTITVETQRVPISPKDMDIWKGDKKVLNFDRLAFGEYEFSDGKKFGLPDEFKFKRFLPEDLKWDIPFEDKFSGEEINVKSGDAFELCVDLPRKTKRVIEGEEVISQNGKGPSGPWPPFFYTTFMAAIFYIFMSTIK